MFVKKTSMLNPVKSLAYIRCYSLSSPRPIRSQSNSIRYNCQKICSWLRRSETILEIRKKATFLEVIKKSIIYKLFQEFTNHSNKTNRAVNFNLRPLLKFLITGTTDEIIQQSGKEDIFRQILKSSAGMHGSSGSQFFRITTGIQSGPNAFDESGSVVNF